MRQMNNRWRPRVGSPRPQYVAAVALAAVLAGLTATPGVAQGGERSGSAVQDKAAGSTGSTRHHVTLITGDRVTLETAPSGGQSVSVEPAEGREHITFVKRQNGSDWTVIPVDALPLIAADRLDKALFNVSALAKGKYAEGSRLPLIVQYAGDAGTAERRLTAAGADGVRTIPGTPFATLGQDRKDAAGFWKDIAPAEAGARSFGAGIRRVWLDGRSTVRLDRTVPHIGAPQAWAKGYKGDGVKVAVLDTGYDPNHPDLKGLIEESANFTAEADTDDLHGHGTHVTSTVAGSGAASDGRFKGVAPGARILSGKVCDSRGSCDNSDILEGMAWAAERGAKVISLSLGDTDTPETDALEAMVETVTRDHGVLVVAAAGNSGPGKVGSPASADRALAVGATDLDDELAPFSSIGPRVGDFGLKPDLVAPGVGVVAARAGGTTAEDGYTAMDGTSMATPHVAGAAAILFQQHPDWTPEQVKRQLMQSTAAGKERGAYFQGAGRVDVARAVGQQVTAETTGLDYGQIRWSDGPRPPVKKTITYRNPGSAPVTLGLSLNVSHGAGKPAPEGLFRLGADKVTVPAHGTADVTVTATPETATTYAAYSGVVIAATADQAVSVRVPVGMDVEQPSHSLRISVKDRAGKAPAHAYLTVSSADGEAREVELHGTSGTELRVPRDGRTYSVNGFLFDAEYTEATVVGAPKIVMSTDRDVAIDARKAKPVNVSAPSRAARIKYAEIGTIGLDGDLFSVPVNDAVGGDRIENVYAVPTATAKDSAFTYLVSTIWVDPAGTDGNPSSVYYLTRPVRGAIPADPGYRPRTSQLATVNSTLAATGPDTTAYRSVWLSLGKFRWVHGMDGLPLPNRRVDYFSPSEDLRWQSVFEQNFFTDPDAHGQSFLSRLHSYKAGSFEERWNQGVQGSGFAPEGMNTFREGDTMLFAIQDAANGNLDVVAGTTTSSRPTWELRRNGEVVSTTRGYATVPADTTPAEYVATFEQERDLAPGSISTTLRSEWRFRSQTTATRQALPLSAVLMSPRLDEWNRAKAGCRFDIPTLIQRPVGAAESPIRTFTAEVSYDEGRTWHSAKVKGSGMQRTVTVDHPRRSSGGSVSLRTYVKDAAGNSFKQTVIKAYLLK
ncbi:S8 family serine peptidase [Streptomyces sp. NPDC026673]|uniref:S8 family serine peptidase n=1 Tax=Streptomyces sp. NPDC026673 TaxID=3155724 RepID=UPI0033C2538F